MHDKVVADLRAQRAFESAKTHAEAIKNSLGEGDLKTAYEAYDGLEAASKEECSSFFETNPFPKMNAELGGIFAGFRFPVIVSDKAGARDEDNKLLHQIQNEDFVADLFKLLQSDGELGVGVIEVPASEQIFVVQLAGIDHVTKPDARKGHMLMAFDPGLFGNTHFRDQVQARIDALKASKKAPGVDAIRMPGEGSAERRRAALAAGAPILTDLLPRMGLTSEHFRGAVERVAFTPTGDRDEDARAFTQATMRSLERTVRQHPEQWYMFRNLWVADRAREEAA